MTKIDNINPEDDLIRELQIGHLLKRKAEISNILDDWKTKLINNNQIEELMIEELLLIKEISSYDFKRRKSYDSDG